MGSWRNAIKQIVFTGHAYREICVSASLFIQGVTAVRPIGKIQWSGSIKHLSSTGKRRQFVNLEDCYWNIRIPVTGCQHSDICVFSEISGSSTSKKRSVYLYSGVAHVPIHSYIKKPLIVSEDGLLH